MVAFLAVVTAIMVGGLIGLAVVAVSRSRDHDQILLRISGSLERMAEGPETSFSHRLVEVEDLVDRLPKKWEDIKREAAASDSRARSHIRRVKKELDDLGLADAGVDQLGEELGVSNGEGGDAGGVRPLREEVASVEGSPSEVAIPGAVNWRDATRSHKYGG